MNLLVLVASKFSRTAVFGPTLPLVFSPRGEMKHLRGVLIYCNHEYGQLSSTPQR